MMTASLRGMIIAVDRRGGCIACYAGRFRFDISDLWELPAGPHLRGVKVWFDANGDRAVNVMPVAK